MTAIGISSRHDTAMALHRHAYRYVSQQRPYSEFLELLDQLERQYGDDPAYQFSRDYPELPQQLWRTATASLAAGMSALQAFPYSGDLNDEQTD